MNELSLFSGAGGGLQGSLLLGWRPIGYVEKNEYCQKVIAQRVRDKVLPEAPIFGDIRAFINQGYAQAYSQMVDVVTGGFPCQPFSIAGQKKYEADDRNLWPETIDCIRIIRPQFCLLENVANLTTHQYFGKILGDLAEAGYDTRWCVLSACAVGAPHPRKRLFILAHTIGQRGIGGGKRQDGATSAQWKKKTEREFSGTQGRRPIKTSIWHQQESDVLRVADGVGSKLERIRATGNGQVPIVVATAWHYLTNEIGD